MRMVHYYMIACAVVVPALLVTTGLGLAGQVELHFRVALVTAFATVGLHSLLILFMILTGRILREAVRSRDLSQAFLDELNEFFARKKAYPVALVAALLIVVAGVLSMAQSALGLPAATHMLAGIVALVFNLWAIPLELRTLRDNQLLIDRAATELDAIDVKLAAQGKIPQDEPITPAAMARGALIVALSSWLPYLYWGLVVWQGDFNEVSLHPWVELSAAGLFVWLLARSEMRRAAPSDSGRTG